MMRSLCFVLSLRSGGGGCIIYQGVIIVEPCSLKRVGSAVGVGAMFEDPHK